MVNYVETMLVPALPTLVVFFDGVPYTTIAWVVSAYLLVGVSTTPLFAKLGDLYGKKRMLIVVLGIYTVAVAITGFTPSIAALFGLSRFNAVYLLIAVRGLQGVGLAMFPLAFAMVGEELPPAKVGQAQGLIAAMFAIGAALGLFGGAWVIQTYGWQDAYHLVIPFAIAILALTIVALPESRHRMQARLDVPGAAFLGSALALVLVGLSQGPSWGWGQLAAIRFASVPLGVPELFALSGLFAVLFYLRERTAKDPMIRLERFRERNLAIAYVGALLVGVSLFLGFVGITILVETPIVGLGAYRLRVRGPQSAHHDVDARRGPVHRSGNHPVRPEAGHDAGLGARDRRVRADAHLRPKLHRGPAHADPDVRGPRDDDHLGHQHRRPLLAEGRDRHPDGDGRDVPGPRGEHRPSPGRDDPRELHRGLRDRSRRPGPAVTVVLPTLTAFHGLFAVGALLALSVGVMAAFLRNYSFTAAGERSDAPSPVPVSVAEAVAPTVVVTAGRAEDGEPSTAGL